MPDTGAAREEALRKFMISRIREGGAVPFSQFMDWCLYHPRYGYYQAEGVKIGKEGDFYTASCVHPLFGAMVAKQLCQMSQLLGGETFTVLEIGGGRGFLCADILAWAEEHDREFSRRLKYGILEGSPAFLREQQDRLARAGQAGKVFWLGPEELRGGGFSLEGCVLSNELVDAFPVHRLVYRGGAWQEIYVGEAEGQFREIEGRLSDPRLGAYFRDTGLTFAEGQQLEVNLQALDWLEEVGQCLARGFLLTVDYGYRAAELYDPGRRNGTLRCYFRHQVSATPYDRVGRQDMTASVDFSALIRKGEEIGLCCTGLVPQYRFLLALGLAEAITAAQQGLSPVEGLKLRLSLKHLLEPEQGMGEVFKVLIQHKGMDRPELAGLRELRNCL